MAALGSGLKSFDSPDNWREYSKQLERYFIANGIPGDKQSEILLAVVNSSIYEVLRDACQPEPPQFKTYADLSKLIEKHYSQEAILFQERIKFQLAQQADSESVTQWLYRITSLAVFCEFGKQHDPMLRDKFVSGLFDQTIAHRLCTENCKRTTPFRVMVDVAIELEDTVATKQKYEKQPRGIRLLNPLDKSEGEGSKDPSSKGEILDLAVEMHATVEKRTASQLQNPLRKISSSITNILDLSEKMLIKIISHLNARERIPLGNSCQRFSHLVFENEELLRELDFSKNGHLTSVSDIEQYFLNEKTSEHIRIVNLTNVRDLKPSILNTIRNAVNLIDINMGATTIQNIYQLKYFLNPLLHVQRLTILYEIEEDPRSTDYSQLVGKTFRTLTYLSVTLQYRHVKQFLVLLQLCEQLKELQIWGKKVEPTDPCHEKDYSNGEEPPQVLKNLEVVQCCAVWAKEIKKHLAAILPNPEKWTDFQLDNYVERRFYFEKNVEICTELRNTMEMKKYRTMPAVVPEILLTEVMRIRNLIVPQKFCCSSLSERDERCVLKIDDAKRLLKNPRHEISHLCVNHQKAMECNLHLITIAFPHLTELVLCCFSLEYGVPPERTYERRKRVAVQEAKDDLRKIDENFYYKMLVENTPHLKYLTIQGDGSRGQYKQQEQQMLNAIPGWKGLKSLRLWNLKFEDGDFLIEIGLKCKNLYKIELHGLETFNRNYYLEALLQMLPHCGNLEDVSIVLCSIYPASEVYIAIAGLGQLKKVHGSFPCTGNITDIISSTEQLFRRCSRLSIFSLETYCMSDTERDKLLVATSRLREELICKERNFQMRIVGECSNPSDKMEIGTLYEDLLHTP